MLAILVVMGTKYACNFKNFKNTLKVIVLSQKAISKKSRLQAYMVPILTEIAVIFGPYYNQNCKHNRSPL